MRASSRKKAILTVLSIFPLILVLLKLNSRLPNSNNVSNIFNSNKLQLHTNLNRQKYYELFAKSHRNRNRSRIRAFPCDDIHPTSYLARRGRYPVFYNFFRPSWVFECDESITYTTHGDITFLPYLVPLLERWQGPISIALFAPGTDFDRTVKVIEYLRECSSPLVKEFVSFHLFFPPKHIPRNIADIPNRLVSSLPGRRPTINDCSESITGYIQATLSRNVTYRKKHNLLYPINVARNVAKEMATTHYILASDIELFPSLNLIPQFLKMLKRNPKTSKVRRRRQRKRKSRKLRPTIPKPKVYVLPPFEVQANVTRLPGNKTELQELLKVEMAIPFHRNFCSVCHRVPQQEAWQSLNMTQELNVFRVAKRVLHYQSWEPFYIGTKLDPVFDERLTWEGWANKMTQAYIMCLLDYEYHVLDNAFLVHRPGIKKGRIEGGMIIPPVAQKQYRMITEIIVPQIDNLYGRKRGCVVHGTYRPPGPPPTAKLIKKSRNDRNRVVYSSITESSYSNGTRK